MRISRLALLGVLVTCAGSCTTNESQPTQDLSDNGGPDPTSCVTVDTIDFICDVISPEDLAVLPGNEWIIASGNQEGGKLHLVNVSSKTTSLFFPTASPTIQHNTDLYPTCPGPMDPTEGTAFRAHGLYLKPSADNRHTLYLVHHGNRESIEVFTVDAQGNVPTITWVGCAVAPDPLVLNSVVALPGGGFAATSFRTKGRTESFDEILNGTLSGSVWEWDTATGWHEVPGSDTGGPNGLEISRDGKWFYIAGWGSQQFIRLSRGIKPIERAHIDLHFRPDNLRMQNDGSIFASGADNFDTTEETLHIARIQPETFDMEHIIDRPVIQDFAACTSAVQIEDEIWMGTNRGKMIGIFPVH